jgi:hypothetical protein
MMSNPAAEEWVRLRWEKDTRYYEAHLHQDLWGGWVLTKVWGRRDSALGSSRPFAVRVLRGSEDGAGVGTEETRSARLPPNKH